MDIIKEIPERSKQIWERLKEDWKVLSIPERAGVVALAIITTPAIAVITADFVGRKKLKEVV